MKSFKEMTDSGLKWADRNSATILSTVGVCGFIYAGVNAVRKTPLALDMIEEARHEKRLAVVNTDEYLTNEEFEKVIALKPIEIVQSCWKVYAPEVIIAALSTVCVIKANSIQTRRTAALATAVKVSQEALSEFKAKAIEVVGEKKVGKIKEEIAKERLESNPVKDNQIIMVSSETDTLCCDSLSGRYFKLPIEDIKKAENKLNQLLYSDGYCSVNTLYQYLGLEYTDLGGLLGWSMARSGYVTIEQIPQIASNGQPCIYLDYSDMPYYEFDRLF